MKPPDITFDEARLATLADYQILDTPQEKGFDDIAELAAQICEVPVALVSLVSDNRQWFKAHHGFEGCETDIGSSVCAHALIVPDLLIIPDLTRDPRSAHNPLVTGAPHIRFYAGAPLRADSGHVIGSLCVIDAKPHPDGLTERQADVLRNLARQVMNLLELRRALAQRDDLIAERRQAELRLTAVEQRLRVSEAHWRSLFEELSEGFVVGRVIRDGRGRITDWRYVDVNAAWAGLLGVAREDVVGRTVREVFPAVQDAWVDAFGQIVATGQAVTFPRQLGVRQRWYEARGFPLKDDQFAVIFMDVTAHVHADARRNALLELGVRLRSLRSTEEVMRAASEIVGKTLNVCRAGFGWLDLAGESVQIEPDWTSDGAASIAGRYRFADYGDILDGLIRGEPLIIDDVRSDPRTAAHVQAMRELDIAALVNMPVREHGRTIAIVLVHNSEPRIWAPEELTFLRNIVDRVEMSVVRIQAEADQTTVNHELSHRMKNTLAMVQAIATQTLRSVPDRKPVEAFMQRVHALAAAHDVLLQQNWTAARIDAIVAAVLGALNRLDRFDIAGPRIDLGARATLSITLLLHELATNAMKYGALSNDTGRVALDWRDSRTDDGKTELILTWRETGGPAVREPAGSGFGSRLIRMGLIGTGGVELRYPVTGFEAEFRAPFDQIEKT